MSLRTGRRGVMVPVCMLLFSKSDGLNIVFESIEKQCVLYPIKITAIFCSNLFGEGLAMETGGALLLSQKIKIWWKRFTLWIIGLACLGLTLKTMHATIDAGSNNNASKIQNLTKDFEEANSSLESIKTSIKEFEDSRKQLPPDWLKRRNEIGKAIDGKIKEKDTAVKKRSDIAKEIEALQKLENGSVSGGLDLARRVAFMILTIVSGHAFEHYRRKYF